MGCWVAVGNDVGLTLGESDGLAHREGLSLDVGKGVKVGSEQAEVMIIRAKNKKKERSLGIGNILVCQKI